MNLNQDPVILRAAGSAAIAASTILTHQRLGSGTNSRLLPRKFKRVNFEVIHDAVHKLDNAANQVDIFFQTTHDGTTWRDVEAKQYLDTGAETGFNDGEQNSYDVTMQGKMSAEEAIAITDAGMTSPGKNDLAPGRGFRVKIVFANTTSDPDLTLGIKVTLVEED